MSIGKQPFDSIEDKVMKEITSGRVKLRSRYIFLAEQLGVGSAFALSILLAILFANIILYYLQSSGNLEYLSFGQRGIFAFFEFFPYLPVILLVLLMFVVGVIFKKSQWTYKKPFGFFAVGIVVAVTAAGGILVWAGVSEQMENEAYGPRPTNIFFKPFFQADKMVRQRGVAGRVVEAGVDFLVVQTPRGLEKINISQAETASGTVFEVGAFVMTVGNRSSSEFCATNIKIMDPQNAPMMGRGVHRRFGDFSPPPGRPPEDVRVCLHGCSVDFTTSTDCHARCFQK